MNTSRPRALVTGASGGIGYELAKVLAREGSDLVLVARSTEQLEKIAADMHEDFGVDVRVVPADLSEPGAPDRIYERLDADGLRVDTLVSAPSGRLEIGTASAPIEPVVTARVLFIDRRPIDRAVDPQQLGRGAVLHGATAFPLATRYGAYVARVRRCEAERQSVAELPARIRHAAGSAET